MFAKYKALANRKLFNKYKNGHEKINMKTDKIKLLIESY